MKKRLSLFAVSFVAIGALVGCSEATPAAPPDASNTPPPTIAAFATDIPATAVPTPSPAIDEDLPPSVQILGPKYQEAYRLLPDGPWTQQYYLAEFTDNFDPDEYAALEDDDSTIPVRVVAAELDASEEWLLTRVIDDSSMSDWLDGKIQELGSDAVAVYKMAETPLDGFRMLVALGWDDDVFLISREWQDRKAGASESQIEQMREANRVMRSTMGVFSQLSPKLRTQRIWERKVCVSLLSAALDGSEFPWRVLSDGACDIDEVLRLSREALDTRNGQYRFTDEGYKELIEKRGV